MTGVVLANVDYQRHMTNEGDQFQEGLRAAGWTLSGLGYDGLQDVPTILARYQPSRVVVHDKRDWDPASAISFRKDLGFAALGALRATPAFVAVVVKDAASSLAYQQAFYSEVDADAAIVYYHEARVRQHGSWLRSKPLIRTYHSLSAADVAGVSVEGPRAPAVVSGALSGAYPLRQQVVRAAAQIGIDVLPHPGYGNTGARTAAYLRQLAGYRVHVATASRYGFALRKIIESVAVGCTVVTDLPADDVLPEIDGALIRVRPTIGMEALRRIVATASEAWSAEARQPWAAKARAFYDYRAIGARLDRALADAAAAREGRVA